MKGLADGTFVVVNENRRQGWPEAGFAVVAIDEPITWSTLQDAAFSLVSVADNAGFRTTERLGIYRLVRVSDGELAAAVAVARAEIDKEVEQSA